MDQIITVILSLLNVALIIAVIALLGSRQNTPASPKNMELEGLNLIEFQQNLKDLIEALRIAGEQSAEKAAVSKEKLEQTLRDADKAAKEMKYLIDRAKLMRDTEYRSEMGKTARGNEANETIHAAAETIKKQPPPAAIIAEKKLESKFSISDENENINIISQDSPREWVAGLLNNGISVEEIAVITGMSKGEIELIRNLKK